MLPLVSHIGERLRPTPRRAFTARRLLYLAERTLEDCELTPTVEDLVTAPEALVPLLHAVEDGVRALPDPPGFTAPAVRMAVEEQHAAVGDTCAHVTESAIALTVTNSIN